jgi:hypothetical protein
MFRGSMLSCRGSVSLLIVFLMLVSALPTLPLTQGAEGATPVALEDNAILKFDFGNRLSPTMVGWTPVMGSLLYSRGAGYGWDVAHQDFYNTRKPPELSPFVLQRSWVIARYGNAMTVDGVRDTDPMTFSADLPNGDYRVRATVGDLFYQRYSMNITAEGEQVAGELAAFHMVHRSVYMKDPRGNFANYGRPLPYWFSVTVADGVLDITFDGTDDLFWDRMDIENRTAPPNSYLSQMSTGAIKPGGQSPPYRFIGGPFSMNSVLGLEIYPARSDLLTIGPSGLVLDGSVTDGSVIAAVAEYNSASTQYEYDQLGAAVQELLVDHETGEYRDLKALEELMAHIQGNLDADLDPVQLYDRIDGLTTLLTRDPMDQTLWEILNQTERLRTALDFTFRRVETGKNHFYENSKTISILWSFQPGDVLHHSAELWRARALYMLDPHRWTSASGTGADIMEALRPFDTDNPYITMYRDTLPGGGRIWKEGQRVISTTGKVDHWTKAEVTEGWEGAPQWARWLREELYWLYDITDWWVLNRQQPDGALGGGWSDDVEFIGLFGFDALISQGADDLSLVGARRFVDGMLESGGVDLERGYSTALADAEHTAEWTGDSLPMMIAVDYGNPKWVEFSYKTGVLMRDLWMGETDLGHTHFRSNYLSATRVGGVNTAEDAYINYRAALPAHWVGWYNGDPEIERLFIDWATAWVEDAMRTDDGKPRGVFPASVGFEDDELGGRNSPNWYTALHPGGTVNYDWQPMKYRGYLEELVRGAYEATGNLSLLEPFKLEAQLAQAYLDDPVPSPTPGSGAWAGMVLGSKAIQRWDSMRIDYGIEGGGGMSGEPNGYSPEDVIGMTRMGRRYIDYCLPLMTTEASATDRVAFVGIINPFMVYTGGGVGGALLAPKVTYTGLERDFAACVMDARPSGLQVLMYGFHHGTKDAGLVLWELENGGTYQVTVGDDNDGDGVVDTVDYTRTFEYLTKGQEVPIKLVGSAEKLVTVRQVENGTDVRVLLPDLAITREDISENATTGKLDILVHNIGANVSGPFFVTVEDADLADNDLARVWSGNLSQPVDLLPSTRLISLRLERAPSFGNVSVTIGPIPGSDFIEITTLNNRAEASLNLSLLSFNSRPMYIGPDEPVPLVLDEDQNIAEPILIANLTELFEDDRGWDNLDFSVSTEPPGQTHVEAGIVNDSLMVFSLEKDWNGNVSFLITAEDLYDRGMETYSPPFVVIVRPVNDPPMYTGPAEVEVHQGVEDQDLSDPVELVDVTGMFYDVDGDDLRYTLEIKEEHSVGVTLELVDGIVVWTSVEKDWWGDVLFRVVALDGGADGVVGNDDDAVASTPYHNLSVAPVNDPPVLVGSIPRGTIRDHEPYELDLEPYFEDPDGDALFFAIAVEPEGIVGVSWPAAGPSDAFVVFTPTDEDFYGYLQVNVTCYDRDPTGSAEQPGIVVGEFLIEIVGPHTPMEYHPWAPNISATPEDPEEGEPVTFKATGAFDPEGTELTYQWRIDGNIMVDWTTDTSVTFTFEEEGNYTISVTVRDMAGLTNETNMPISVTKEVVGPPDPDPQPDSEPGSFYMGILVGVVIAVVVLLVVLYMYNRRDV